MTGTAAGTALSDGRIAGTHDAVRSHLELLAGVAGRLRIKRERRDDLLLVLAEVLNNIVEHAIADQSDGWIDCRLRCEAGRLSVQTADNGRPLPPGLLSGGAMPELSDVLDDLPEGGFGWFIIHSLVDDMVYEREEGRNTLTFTLSLQ